VAKPKLIARSAFMALRPALEAQLAARLEQERIDTTLPGPGPEDTDLWDDLPPIDSKSVVKLSPILEEQTGHRLDPRWIRKGGYESVADAVTDLLNHVEQHCVEAAPSPPPQSTKPALETV
jgi:hypothetical protein